MPQSGFGAMLFGMDSSIISGVVVLPAFLTRFGLAGAPNKAALANLQANIVSTLQAGCFAGAIIAGFMADRIGRRMSLLVAGVVVLVGVILQFNSWGHLAALYVGRFIAGLGVGVCSVVTPLYTSENVPRAIRGLLTGTYQFFIVLGGMLPTGSTMVQAFIFLAIVLGSYLLQSKACQLSSCWFACSFAMNHHAGL